MPHSKKRSKSNKDDALLPYDDLFIYYFKGRSTFDESTLSDGFIGTWQEDGSSFLFFSKPSRKIIEKILRQQPHLTLLDEFHMSYDQWHGIKIEPFNVGGFHISPPWQKFCDKKYRCQYRLSIVLDPGVVFGTGIHSTTKDCLAALEWVFGREKILRSILTAY